MEFIKENIIKSSFYSITASSTNHRERRQIRLEGR